jgi:5-formyltetrahydrofolate cyclo-ligase
MTKDQISIAKSQLRDQYRKDRKARFIEESWLHILSISEFTNKKNIASYLSYEFEPNTNDLNKKLIQSGVSLYLPRLLKDNDLEWVKWNGESTNLKKSGKVLEPIGESEIVDLEVIITPALHIDRSGNRLGQGGGSYDRALAKSNAWKIALVHPGEITSEPLPVSGFDQKVDAAATPTMVVRF